MSEVSHLPSANTSSCQPELQMIEVCGHRLALASSGAGSPPVVLETGLGAESAEWAAVQDELSRTTRVIRYDRANRGSSEPTRAPRTALDMVADLRQLLRASGVASPRILVGHSFGGLLVRLYAHHHPDEVAGLILVDAMHQDQFEIFGPLFPPPRQSDPPELTAVRSFWQGGWRSPDATSEKIDFVSSIRQAREITSLGGIRLHVLIAGTFLNQPLVPLQFRAQLQERWETLQMEFIKLSTRATYSLELRSGHFLQREAPWAVIDAVRALIAGPC